MAWALWSYPECVTATTSASASSSTVTVLSGKRTPRTNPCRRRGLWAECGGLGLDHVVEIGDQNTDLTDAVAAGHPAEIRRSRLESWPARN
jgi:hypothetical protein